MKGDLAFEGVLSRQHGAAHARAGPLPETLEQGTLHAADVVTGAHGGACPHRAAGLLQDVEVMRGVEPLQKLAAGERGVSQSFRRQPPHGLAQVEHGALPAGRQRMMAAECRPPEHGMAYEAGILPAMAAGRAHETAFDPDPNRRLPRAHRISTRPAHSRIRTREYLQAFPTGAR